MLQMVIGQKNRSRDNAADRDWSNNRSRDNAADVDWSKNRSRDNANMLADCYWSVLLLASKGNCD